MSSSSVQSVHQQDGLLVLLQLGDPRRIAPLSTGAGDCGSCATHSGGDSSTSRAIASCDASPQADTAQPADQEGEDSAAQMPSSHEGEQQREEVNNGSRAIAKEGALLMGEANSLQQYNGKPASSADVLGHMAGSRRHQARGDGLRASAATRGSRPGSAALAPAPAQHAAAGAAARVRASTGSIPASAAVSISGAILRKERPSNNVAAQRARRSLPVNAQQRSALSNHNRGDLGAWACEQGAATPVGQACRSSSGSRGGSSSSSRSCGGGSSRSAGWAGSVSSSRFSGGSSKGAVGPPVWPRTLLAEENTLLAEQLQ
ncbi:hypothetical protein MNEG_4971, partial [Monoraphidium neglectum]